MSRFKQIYDLLLGRVHSCPGPQVRHPCYIVLCFNIGWSCHVPWAFTKTEFPSSMEETSQTRAVVTRTTQYVSLFLPAWGIWALYWGKWKEEVLSWYLAHCKISICLLNKEIYVWIPLRNALHAIFYILTQAFMVMNGDGNTGLHIQYYFLFTCNMLLAGIRGSDGSAGSCAVDWYVSRGGNLSIWFPCAKPCVGSRVKAVRELEVQKNQTEGSRLTTVRSGFVSSSALKMKTLLYLRHLKQLDFIIVFSLTLVYLFLIWNANTKFILLLLKSGLTKAFKIYYLLENMVSFIIFLYCP